MDAQLLNTIANFIWGIADDCLRDVYVRGKYRDVILPMTVIRRLDAVLEDTKQQVLDMKKVLDGAGITNQWGALCNAAGQAFCNASPFCLRDLTGRSAGQKLKTDFEAYLDGFSPERAGNSGQVQVPQPDRNHGRGRYSRRGHSEVCQPGCQPQPQAVRRPCPAWTTMPWAPSLKSWCAASTRPTTRKPASTGRPATSWS